MTTTQTEQLAVTEKFRELHAAGCFVLPNPWDVGSAVYLEHLGFQALATTSAGFAFSRARPDSVTGVPRDLMLDHFRDIVNATRLPVNADFQNGYADEPEGVADSVTRCIATGVAGLSIEDSTGRDDTPLYDFNLAVERIKAARAAVDASGVPVILTARCEVFLVGQAEPLKTALERLTAFAAAGADCLYAPGVQRPDDIREIVRAVAPKPVNVLVSTGNRSLTHSQLEDLGVRRISVGSALANVAWGAFMRAAQEIKDNGTFETFGAAAAYADLNGLFNQQLRNRE